MDYREHPPCCIRVHHADWKSSWASCKAPKRSPDDSHQILQVSIANATSGGSSELSQTQVHPILQRSTVQWFGIGPYTASQPGRASFARTEPEPDPLDVASFLPPLMTLYHSSLHVPPPLFYVNSPPFYLSECVPGWQFVFVQSCTLFCTVLYPQSVPYSFLTVLHSALPQLQCRTHAHRNPAKSITESPSPWLLPSLNLECNHCILYPYCISIHLPCYIAVNVLCVHGWKRPLSFVLLSSRYSNKNPSPLFWSIHLFSHQQWLIYSLSECFQNMGSFFCKVRNTGCNIKVQNLGLPIY